MKAPNPNNHRQLYAELQTDQPQGQPELQFEELNDKPGVFWVSAAIALILAIYGLANLLDMEHARQQREIDARVDAHIAQQQADRLWEERLVKRAAIAYAKGREEALRVKPGTPEATQLALACTSLYPTAAGRP